MSSSACASNPAEKTISSGLKSWSAGSQVTVTAKPLNGATSKQAVQIQVSDNGPGLPQEALRLVFDPFVVRSDSPMEYGIHLMACFFIVHHHGGKIEAHGTAGQGTEFRLEFPLNGNTPTLSVENREFFQKLRATDELWEKLLATR